MMPMLTNEMPVLYAALGTTTFGVICYWIGRVRGHAEGWALGISDARDLIEKLVTDVDDGSAQS